MSAAKPPLKNLPDDPEQLKAIILQLSTRVSALEEYIRLEQLRKFASKSEKAPASQYEMFNEAELCEAAEAALVETEAAETASPAKRTLSTSVKPGEKLYTSGRGTAFML